MRLAQTGGDMAAFDAVELAVAEHDGQDDGVGLAVPGVESHLGLDACQLPQGVRMQTCVFADGASTRHACAGGREDADGNLVLV